jgi:hypothetical protein
MNRSAKKSTGSGDTGSDTRLRLLIASTWNGAASADPPLAPFTGTSAYQVHMYLSKGNPVGVTKRASFVT